MDIPWQTIAVAVAAFAALVMTGMLQYEYQRVGESPKVRPYTIILLALIALVIILFGSLMISR